MKLELSCSMCGKEKEIVIQRGLIDQHGSLKDLIESEGWITQQNGSILDTYCSKKCAVA